MLKNKKVILSIILSVLLCLVSFTVNAKENSKIELRIEGPKAVEVGKTINLSAIQKISNDLGVEMPEGITSEYFNEENVTEAVTWISNVPEVATVENGIVTGVKEGVTTITAEYEKYTAQIVITVTKAKMELTGEELSGEEFSGEEIDEDWEIKNINIEKIEILKAPKKVEYNVGEKFDYSGIEISVYYLAEDTDGKKITGTWIIGDEGFEYFFKIDLDGALKTEDKAIKIILLDNEKITAEQKITVKEGKSPKNNEKANDGRANGVLPYAGGTVAMVLASGLVIASGIYIFKRRNDLKGI